MNTAIGWIFGLMFVIPFLIIGFKICRGALRSIALMHGLYHLAHQPDPFVNQGTSMDDDSYLDHTYVDAHGSTCIAKHRF